MECDEPTSWWSCSDIPFLGRQFRHSGFAQRCRRGTVAAARCRLQAERRRWRLRRQQFESVVAAAQLAADGRSVQSIRPTVGTEATAPVPVDSVAEYEEQYNDSGRNADDQSDVQAEARPVHGPRSTTYGSRRRRSHAPGSRPSPRSCGRASIDVVRGRPRSDGDHAAASWCRQGTNDGQR